MNWFERYGIPGAYFTVLVVSLLLLGNWGCLGQWAVDHKELAGLLVAGVVAASLPAGYILAIVAQCLYYLPGWPWQLHTRAWKWAWCARRNKHSDEFHEPGAQTTEWKIEADATLVARWRHTYLGEDGLRRSQFLQQWFVKRTDVMAMNSAMIVGTLGVWGIAGFGGRLGLFGKEHQSGLAVWCAVSGLVFLLLCLANNVLSKQAVRILREYLRDLDSEGDCRACLLEC